MAASQKDSALPASAPGAALSEDMHDTITSAPLPAVTNAQNVEEKGDGQEKPHWLTQTEHVIPKNNMVLVLTGLMLTVGLAALDQTIVSTALPVIALKLHSGPSGYAWVGTAYLLVIAALNPLYARLSDYIGRKPLLWAAIIIFLVGSALCGASQSMTMLCICRGIQGAGGGGVIVLANIVLSDLVSLEKRGSAQALFGFTWGLASCIGPLLGGVLTDKASWRWVFFINLPVGALAAAFLIPLKLNKPPARPLTDLVNEFDWLGLAVMMAGIVFVLLGFSFAEISPSAFNNSKTIAFLTVGGCFLLIALPYIEMTTKRRAIIPPRIFKIRTTGLILISVLCHGMPFFAGTYYLPQYFQAVRGSTPLFSGVQMLPFSLLSAIMSIISGLVIVRLQSYRVILWCGFAIMTVGYGLMATLTSTSNVAKQELYIAVAALGLGQLFQTPLIGLTAATPHKDMASVTGCMQVVRAISGSAGISLAGAVYNSILRKQLSTIPNYMPLDASGDIRSLIHLQPPSLAAAVTHAYGEALRTIWIVMAPIVGVGFLCVLGVKKYSLKRKIVRNGDGAVVGDATPMPLGEEKTRSIDEEKVVAEEVEGEDSDSATRLPSRELESSEVKKDSADLEKGSS